jgi:hypothetical protein
MIVEIKLPNGSSMLDKCLCSENRIRSAPSIGQREDLDLVAYIDGVLGLADEDIVAL